MRTIDNGTLVGAGLSVAVYHGFAPATEQAAGPPSKQPKPVAQLVVDSDR